MPMILRSGSATAEALRRLRSRGSRIDLVDGLETGSPDFHLHSSLHCSSSPLSESALICSSFLSKEMYIVFIPNGSHVAEATRALRSFSVHYMILSPQTVFTCLGV